MTMSANLHIKPDAHLAEAKEAISGGGPLRWVNVHADRVGVISVSLLYPDGTPFALVEAVAAAHNAALAATRPAQPAADSEWDAAAPAASVADAIIDGDADKLAAFVAQTEGPSEPEYKPAITLDEAAEITAQAWAGVEPPLPPLADLNPAKDRPAGWTMSRMTRGQNPGSFHHWTFVNDEHREIKVAHPSEAGAWVELAKALREGQG